VELVEIVLVISSNPMVPAITLSSDDAADDVRASAGSSKFLVVEELMTTVRRMSSPCVGSKDEAATASVVVSTSSLTVKDIIVSNDSELVHRDGAAFGALAVLMKVAELGTVRMTPSVANVVTTIEVCGESKSGEDDFDVVSASVRRETMFEDSSWSPGLLEALLGTHCG
jgi:hypothetical protein